MNDSSLSLKEILAENERRKSLLPDSVSYDPLSGDQSDPTRRTVTVDWELSPVALPLTMLEDPEYPRMNSALAYKRLRMRHDFEYWAIRCVHIRHKQSGLRVPFRLNAPQRRVLRMFEEDRRAGRPLRFIMLKARQWGGSTLVQMYFAWIQCVLRRNWNSLICAHVKETASGIRGMYDDMLAEYPATYWDEEEKPRFVPWQKSGNTREIAGRGCRVTLASSFGQNAVRGLDFSMAHLSEVAFWNDTDRMAPADFIRSICGGIPQEPLSMIVMESTANGVANYFHTVWRDSMENRSVYRRIFVPWHEIEMYRKPCDDPEKLIAEWTPYERELWEKGLTLEMIQWYHDKRGEFPADQAMMAEYPSDPVEAFANTGSGVFSSRQIEDIRQECRPPLDSDRVMRHEDGTALLESPGADGEMKIWALPARDALRYRNRYVIAVDVGGRSRHSDWSVIAVFDRCPPDGSQRPTLAAQWRGHCDHDLLALYAIRVAEAYHNALLIIESNTLESTSDGRSQYILEEINTRYRNLYVRTPRDKTGYAAPEQKVGFHTNRATKAAAIANLIACVRNRSYGERDAAACDEMATYEQQSNGSYSARKGYHDDVLMTRAIALYVISAMPPLRDRSDTIRYFGLRAS